MMMTTIMMTLKIQENKKVAAKCYFSFAVDVLRENKIKQSMF